MRMIAKSGTLLQIAARNSLGAPPMVILIILKVWWRYLSYGKVWQVAG